MREQKIISAAARLRADSDADVRVIQNACTKSHASRTIALVFSRGVLVDSRQPFAWNQAVIRCRQPHKVSCWPILLQNDFWCWNEEQFSRT